MDAKLRVPTIHSNGTSKEDLVSVLEEACNAIQQAQVILRGTAPHGRDYYPQDTGLIPLGTALCEAQDQHVARVVKLKSVYNELMTIWEAITNGPA